jgi:hypothetical protein
MDAAAFTGDRILQKPVIFEPMAGKAGMYELS